MKLQQMITAAVVLAALSPVAALAQDGSNIDKAIPIIFGQTVTDIADATLAPYKVYKITLAKGQKVKVLATASKGAPSWKMYLLAPSSPAVQRATVLAQSYSGCCNSVTVLGYDYEVPAAGVYFIDVEAYAAGINFSLQVTTDGTPIAVPNPTTAGCVSGRVDYITYSLQLIAVGLPDEVSIGGTKICANCQVKAPLYPEIAQRFENALRSKVNVEACYDSPGNIFQIKLVQ